MPEIKPVVDQQTIINRNVQRWHEEQRRRAKKAQELAARAQRAGLSVPQFKLAKREQALGGGRATIASILSNHLKEAK